jgi:predicted dehydrogenase
VPEVEVVGYVDSDPASLALLRKQLPVSPKQCFLALEDALEATQPEAALITTTLPGHAPVARAALQAGLHVLVEKPFADSVQVAQQIVDLAAARSLVLMVSQNYRFFPAARAVACLVKESPVQPHEVSIDFRRNSAVGPSGRGRHHFEDQPLLVDMSIHHFDLLRLILDREPERIYCEAWNPEGSGFSGPSVAVASIVFEGGVVVSYRGSWVSTAPITPWAGDWRMEFKDREIFWTSRGDDGVKRDQVVVRPIKGRSKAASLPDLERIDRWATLTEFASSVREGREPECSGRDNLGTIAFVAAVVESARRQEPVEVASPWVQSELAV